MQINYRRQKKLVGILVLVIAACAVATLLVLQALAPGADSSKANQTRQSDQDRQARIQEKGREVQEKVPKWIAAGGDEIKIGPLGEKVDKYLKEGKFKEAEETLDEILAIVPASVTEPDPGDTVLPRGEMVPSRGIRRGESAMLGASHSARLARIPAKVEIIYHAGGYIYTMDANGGNVTQITFQRPQQWEHVAASFDRKYVVASTAGGQLSRMWLFDLERGVETELVPHFRKAGSGGVDWDRNGYIYFAGVEREVVPNPRSRRDFITNAAANDIYKIRFDGTGLKRLTNSTDRGEADVSVSEDGTMIAYMATKIDPPNDVTEIWINGSEGGQPRLVYTGGKDKVASVHDPELSPDNSKVVFSKVNNKYKNFRNDPNANTAHDLYVINVDGTGLTLLTTPGAINIIPDWKQGRILYLELNDQERTPFMGISIMNSDGTGRKRIRGGANIAKWIP